MMVCICVFLFFFFFRAAPAAYGGSQARGWIRAATASLHHSHSIGSDLHHSSWPCQIPNPLSEAKDRTHNLMVPSQIHFHCATMGAPEFAFLLFIFVFLLEPNLRPMEIPKIGVTLELQLLTYPQPRQHRIQATSTTYTTQLAATLDLYPHWARPGTEPESSWILVGFVTPAPQRELLEFAYNFIDIAVGPPLALCIFFWGLALLICVRVTRGFMS